MKFKLYIKINLTVLLICIIGITNAQVSSYTFTQGLNQYVGEGPSNYFYQKILLSPSPSSNLLKVIYAGSDTGTIATYATGDGYPIGFNFIYNGESFDRVAVSGNGYIKLGHSGQPITIKNDTLAGEIFDGSSYNQNIVASFQTDANSFNPIALYSYRSELYMYGLPGSRTFVAEFSNITPEGILIRHQIQLEEKNNVVGFAYPSTADYPNTYLKAAVGITSNNDFSNLSVVNGTNTWNTAVRGSVPTSLCDFNSSLLPPPFNGGATMFMYTWTPPVPSPSAPTCPFVYFYVDTSYSGSAKVIFAQNGTSDFYTILADGATNVATNPTINWSDVSVTSHQATTYDVYLDTDYPPLLPIAQNLTTTSYTPATLAPKTKYYYNVVPKNASGKDSGCIGSFTTDSLPQYCSVLSGAAFINTLDLNTFSFVVNSTNQLIPKFPAITPYTTTLKRDTSYTCSGNLIASTPSYPWSRANIRIYIDFNQDGDFDDPGETITTGSTAADSSFTFSVPIPDTAKLGQTVMRILSQNVADISPLTPCDGNSGSQDFIITIAPSTSCQNFTITPLVTNVNCFGQTNGSIALNPAGGATPYTVSWTDGGSTNATRNNLAKGIYQASITDANNCEMAIPLTPVLEPTALSIDTATSNNITSILVSGGTMPYSYLWSNGDTLNNSNNLAAGTYSVTVTDAHGCDTTMQNIIVTKVTTDTIPPPPTGGDSTSVDSSIAIIVYPNPTSGIIHLQSQVQQTIHVVIVSEEGKVIQKGDYTIGTNNAASINVSAFSAGIYFLDIVGDKSSKVVKIIRE